MCGAPGVVCLLVITNGLGCFGLVGLAGLTGLVGSLSGTHLNVMSYMYAVFDLSPPAGNGNGTAGDAGAEQEQAQPIDIDMEPSDEVRAARRIAAGRGSCNAALVESCGRFIGTGRACLQCAGRSLGALAPARCSVENVEATCQAKTEPGDGIELEEALPAKLAPFMW
jgi:hypothetical protein